MAAVLVIALTVAGIFAYNKYKLTTEKFEGTAEVRLYIVGADGPEGLRKNLQKNLGEKFGDAAFQVWDYVVEDKTVPTISFKVKPGITAKELAAKIAGRHQDPVEAKFNNVRTVAEVAARVADSLYISALQFEAAADSLLAARSVAPEMYPAYFLPNTYEYFWNASAEKAAGKIIDHYDDFWTPQRRASAEALGLTPEQVSVLASIVEEETNSWEERPQVARLYLNRLDRGMKLQADPTVKFAVGDLSLRRILNEHLAVESPYNTYLYEGLPPGPIRIVDERTIDCVLNAPKHNFIYMCARPDESGLHNFATTLAEHNRNAAAYRRWLNDRGIK